MPGAQANEFLGASYQVYRRTGTNKTTILRTIGYALPAVQRKHVQTVVPTTYFESTRTLWQTPRSHSVGATMDNMGSRDSQHPNLMVLSNRNNEEITITPSVLRSLCRTPAYVPTATDQNKKNALGIVGLLNQYPSLADLREFMTEYRSDAVDLAFWRQAVGETWQQTRQGRPMARVARVLDQPTKHPADNQHGVW